MKNGFVKIIRILRQNVRQSLNGWALLTILILLAVIVPLLAVLFQSPESSTDTWEHLADTVLQDYVINSLLLMTGVGFLSLVFGLSTAWLVSTCDFPGRKFFAWGLILPMAIPTYIAAFTYAGIFDYTGPIKVFTRQWLNIQPAPEWLDIMNFPGLVLIMALVLYPYVFVIVRSSFLRQSRNVLESSRVLGSSAWRTFFRVALPVNRPAIIGGLMLVLMEVLNDYGAVKYFGVSTFTTGIFRAWFSLGDSLAAVNLSAILMAFVFGLIVLERWQRGKAQFDPGGQGKKPLQLYRLNGLQKTGAFVACLVPFLLGFFIPVLQLLSWSIDTAPEVLDWGFLRLIGNSFLLAVLAGFFCVLAAVLLLYGVKVNQNLLFRSISKIAVMGYSIPGAVIAVGVMLPLLFVDKTLIDVFAQTLGVDIDLFLTGSIFALVYAYLVRFLAVAYNPIDAGFKKMGNSYDEGARILGLSPLKTLWKVNFPLLKGAMLSGGLLVFVDVLKELPLTLILRPFNFDTLATKTFQLAGNELVAESANAALIIILTGLVPIILLNKLISKESG